MAYKKRRLSRFRYKRRTRGGLRRKRFSRTIKRVVRRMSEVKYVTGKNFHTFDAASADITFLVPPIAQGVDKNQRLGNRIKYKMLTINFAMRVNATATGVGANRVVRVLIIQPRVTFSATPNISDFLDDTSHWNSTVKGVNARVLYDKRMVLNTNLVNGVADAQVGGDAGFFQRKLHFRLGNNVNFKSSASGNSDDPKDNYYIVVFNDFIGGAVGEYNIAVDFFARLSYIDL